MENASLDANYGRSVTIDVCHPCGALWFDERESVALTPGATLELFRLIHTRATSRRPLPETGIACPRCARALEATQDRQRNTRFQYHRCLAGHGRFITFAEFLREKNFVRPLDLAELATLRLHVQSVRCQSCGAGVDLEAGSACSYCRAPVSMLDPGQVEAVVQRLHESEARRTTVDPALPARLAVERLQVERLWNDLEAPAGRPLANRARGLLDAGLEIISDLLAARS
jgi:hypothetical protein